jgi:hypothetical protein
LEISEIDHELTILNEEILQTSGSDLINSEKLVNQVLDNLVGFSFNQADRIQEFQNFHFCIVARLHEQNTAVNQ